MTVRSVGRQLLLWAAACLLLFSWVAVANTAHATDTWTNRFAGVKQLRRVTSNQRINVLVVDLTTPGISLRSTKSNERRRTVSSFGSAVSAEAVINGDFFLYSDYSTRGLAVGDGQLWPGSKDSKQFGYIRFDPEGNVRLQVNGDVTPFDASKMKGVVGGWPSIVNNAKMIDRNGVGSHCTARHPRTAVGLSEDNKTLWMVVVDGRSSSAIGMTCNELGKLMVGLGAYRALSLDGGGSSSMWVKGVGIVNRPSDGSPRVVANHLALQAKPLSSIGYVEGTVREAGNASRFLPHATVGIKNVATDTTNERGSFVFALPEGDYTLIAKAEGYEDAEIKVRVTKAKTLIQNPELRPKDPLVDGEGPVMDASVSYDASVPVDDVDADVVEVDGSLVSSGDSGIGEVPADGLSGGCRIRSRPPTVPTLFVALVFLASVGRRRS